MVDGISSADPIVWDWGTTNHDSPQQSPDASCRAHSRSVINREVLGVARPFTLTTKPKAALKIIESMAVLLKRQ